MFRAYLIETISGQVRTELEMSTDGRWDVRLNGTEQATVTVQKSSLESARIRRSWLRPWHAGVLITFEHNRVERPILAGPITEPPNEFPESLSLTVQGIRAIFEYRYITGYEIQSYNSAAERKKMLSRTVSIRRSSLAEIAKEYVRMGTSFKRGGALPIVYDGVLTPPSGASHVRNLSGFDVENNQLEKRLNEITNVENGPDIMFRPRWKRGSRQYIEWVMCAGTEANPTITQDHMIDVDLTGVGSDVSEFSLNTSGKHFATRAYATGAGEGAGIAFGYADDQNLLRDNFPLLETTISHPSTKLVSTLDAHARRAIDTRALVEITPTINGSSDKFPLGLWQVGDKAKVTIDDWWSVPEGLSHELRIIRASGDFDDHMVTIYFQEDSW